MTPAMLRPARRAVGALVLAALFTGLVTLDTGAAATVTTTSNTGNAVSAYVVPAPTNASASVSLNILPLLTCRSRVSWTISSVPSGTTFQVRRLRIDTSAVVGGPWTSSGSPYVDSPIPMIGGSGYKWQVRTVISTGWKSVWVDASSSTALLCLL